MLAAATRRVDLAELRRMKAEGRKFAMLTAYDYPTALAAQAAGVHSLLIGDSLGCVVLGQPNTRGVPLELMIVLAQAVRRGAPGVYFVGDMPYEPMRRGPAAIVDAALRFCDEAGCDAVKIECEPEHDELIESLAARGVATIAHLGLRPQSIDSPDQYRAQARDAAEIDALVALARRLVDAGAAMLLLEAVPNEASLAVVSAVPVPVIGCGAGPACDGHVVVTHDLLGFGTVRPPRFVPVLANLSEIVERAMREYVCAIADGNYPAHQHVYPMRRPSTPDLSRPGSPGHPAGP
jgi:3-methyl-2-oxobutanoate hydroxymethyltransferase